MIRAHTLLLTALAAGPVQAPGVAVTDVTVIDVTTGKAEPGRTVLVSGTTITAVGPAGSRIPAGYRKVDGRGKFLIPGLWDMHVHLAMTGRTALSVLLAAGVTGVRDMGGNPVIVMAWRDSVAAGSLVGPRIKAPGNIVESGRWLRAVIQRTQTIDQPELLAELTRRFALDSAPDGPRIVDSLVGLGADFIKIRNYPGPETYAPLAAAARRRGIRLAGHAPLAAMLGMVSDSGFASFEHSLIDVQGGKLVEAFAGQPDSVRRALYVRFARNGTAYDPTLVSSRVRFIADSAVNRMIADSTGATDPLLAYVGPTLRRSWRAARALERVSSENDWSAIYRSDQVRVREMEEAGVVILAGTDLAVPTLVPGYSLHDELELLVSGGGLTPAQALAAATVNPARVLGLEGSLGSIAPGRMADLVLLDANPLLDIRATRRIQAVIAGGRLFDRASLDRLLAAARVPQS